MPFRSCRHAGLLTAILLLSDCRASRAETTVPEGAIAEMSYDIVADGTSKDMMLRFRIRDVSTAVPRVEKIWIGKPDEARKRRGVPACLVRGDAVSMKEWHYGETPSGFLKFGCQELGPGEYVVSVRFLGGYGGIRMAIDEKGHVTTLPLERRLPLNKGLNATGAGAPAR